MSKLNPHNWAEIFAAISCTICLLTKPSVVNRWFCWFLWLTVFVELTAKWAATNLTIKAPLYNIYACVEFLFYAVLFSRITPAKARKKEIRFYCAIFLIFFLLNFIVIQKPTSVNTKTFTLEGVLLSFFCLTWYYDIVNADVQNKFKWSKLVLVGAILIYFVSTLGVFASFSTLFNKMPADLSNIYSLIVRNLIVITYGSYAIAFIVELFEEGEKQLEAI